MGKRGKARSHFPVLGKKASARRRVASCEARSACSSHTGNHNRLLYGTAHQ